MSALEIETDDEVEVIFPFQQGDTTMPYERIVISSSHSKLVRGASGILDEVDEARRVVERVAEMLEARGVDVTVFHDNTSTSQSENLNCIVNYHNSQERDLDVSVHFNAYVETTKPMGTEVLFVTQSALALAECRQRLRKRATSSTGVGKSAPIWRSSMAPRCRAF